VTLHERISGTGPDEEQEASENTEQDVGKARTNLRAESAAVLQERIALAAAKTKSEEDEKPVALEERPSRGSSFAVPDPYAALKTKIHRACIVELGPQLFAVDHSEVLVQRVRAVVTDQLEQDATPLAREERRDLIREITDDILGYGPLEPFLRDESVTEIMVNGYDQIYIEQAGRIMGTMVSFVDDEHLRRTIDKMATQVGRRIDESSPMVDARLPDGSRINAIIPPLSLSGPILTIRKFSRRPFTMDELIDLGTLSAPAARFLAACIRGRLNLLVSGGTGVGKTSLMNALSTYISNSERIITIEDAAELQLQQNHVLRLESRMANIEGQGEVKIRELVRNALRMRPDRIVVGEVRGAETVDMLQAMNTGHDGSLTTIHANSPRDALGRVETLVLTAGVDMPLRAIREQIARAFDLVVHLVRLVNGNRRILQITEVLGMESEMIQLQDLFVAKPPSGGLDGPVLDLLSPLNETGLRPHFLEKLAVHNVTLADGLFDRKPRATQ
jgi:pilus assembly protein CpaF